ncbi:Clan CD, family C50, separase-like cysteine peptidase [Tritrichomonas foetus]|uniref:separase n=1 Tax=Tritrichomonas foetus TaxID=1144522 RepID=A0A1J4KRW5_9EUKA|nr:Clan CD, family C50, separase-like cysteine peptidase [Tritrichomonas foetus]|eukprot:OHT12406.1 Clan CD, family C50, separase-like cysteine peptidase [Tritrichomonas foetus]
MDELESLIQIAISQKGNAKSFVQAADRIRRVVTPNKSYPGILSEIQPNILQLIIDILVQFNQIIFQKVHMFQQQHISRAIDSLDIAAVASVVKFTFTKSEQDLDDALTMISDSIMFCKQYYQQNIQFPAPAIFNLASYLFKLKAYKYSVQMFEYVIEISTDPKILEKSHKLRCQCLIALQQTENHSFIESLYQAADPENLFVTWVTLLPSTNPVFVTNVLTKIFDKSHPMNMTPILPYFALHGDFEMVSKFSDYKDFFPNIIPPRNVDLLNHPKLNEMFMKCYQAFQNASFYECALNTIKLLKQFPQEKLKPQSMLALFFMYYWIVFSYDAIAKPEAGLFYAKEMRKLFIDFPFTVGFALFLEMKCKIHSNKLDRLREPPQIPFKSVYNWSSINVLFEAIRESFDGDCNCIDLFYSIFDNSPNENILVQREAFHYTIRALKEYECSYDIHFFKEFCFTANETAALYIYYRAIELVQSIGIDFNKVWSFTHPTPVPNEIIQMLDDAETKAHGFSSITRKIRQLKALLIGTSNPVKAAELIATSLSLSLDKFLAAKSPHQRFKLQFPILSIAYVKIIGFESCLLIGGFYPDASPIAVRIETHDDVDNFLDTLNEIQDESTAVPQSLPSKEWWKTKFHLDQKLQNIIHDFEINVLGIWKGLLTPYKYNPSLKPLNSALITYLQSLPKNQILAEKKLLEQMIGESLDVNHYRKSGKRPLSLILGKFIHQIPWESFPFVVENKISITRLPSMRLVAIQSSKQIPLNVNSRSAFYILNPKGDLVNTEQTFKPYFHKLSWNGLIRGHLDSRQFENQLQEKDLFVYCGHGSGNEFYNYSSLVEDKKECKSSMLLMGCSSGKLYDNGEMDPNGVPYSCVSAGSGAVVANLWNVTDRDIDRFLMCLLDQTTRGKPTDLEDAIYESRNSCKLRYLTGAAPVVYGFPTLFRTC